MLNRNICGVALSLALLPSAALADTIFSNGVTSDAAYELVRNYTFTDSNGVQTRYDTASVVFTSGVSYSINGFSVSLFNQGIAGVPQCAGNPCSVSDTAGITFALEAVGSSTILASTTLTAPVGATTLVSSGPLNWTINQQSNYQIVALPQVGAAYHWLDNQHDSGSSLTVTGQTRYLVNQPGKGARSGNLRNYSYSGPSDSGTKYETQSVVFDSGALTYLDEFSVDLQNRGAAATGQCVAPFTCTASDTAGIDFQLLVTGTQTVLHDIVLHATAGQPGKFIDISGLGWALQPNTSYTLQAIPQDGASYRWLFDQADTGLGLIALGGFGSGSSGGATIDAPEPVTLGLLGLAAALVAGRRRATRMA